MEGMECSRSPLCWRVLRLVQHSSGGSWQAQQPCKFPGQLLALRCACPAYQSSPLTVLLSVLSLCPCGHNYSAVLRTPHLCRSFPSLLWLHSSLGLTAEALLAVLCSIGWLLSAAAACSVVHPLLFAAQWLIYLSFKSLGGGFLEYG